MKKSFKLSCLLQDWDANKSNYKSKFILFFFRLVSVIVSSNVVIIRDIEIGDNVKVGAGSVVVKSIPPNSVVAGNPAKVILQG